MHPRLTRRALVTGSGVAAVAALVPGAAQARDDRPMRVLVVGAHPGDPEAGCGGTIARYVREGHAVTALYLTRGEGGVRGKTAAKAAAVRSAEAEAACKLLGATPRFAGQVDAATEVNAVRSADFVKLVEAVEPNVVFTHWPVDTHADHRACASLTLGAWVALKQSFPLYFYEVDLGSDTQCFRPGCYVDVTETESLKRQACMAHASQDPEGFYGRDHVPMMRFRGMECGRKMAEAFVHHDPSPFGRLPGD